MTEALDGIIAAGFTTERLRVAEWHAALPDPERLAAEVAAMLDPSTTRHLPTDWYGDYDLARAERWIAERDAEGATLLATDRSTGRPVGLLLATGSDEVRIGYVIAVDAWGRGLATELVVAFVDQARVAGVASIVAGVAAEHASSVRVLEKAGFAPEAPERGSPVLYRRDLAGGN